MSKRPKDDRVTACIAFAINENAPPVAEWLGEGTTGGWAMFSAADGAELLIAAAATLFLGAAHMGHDEATREAVRVSMHRHLDTAIATVLANPRGALAVLGTAVNMAVNAAYRELQEERAKAAATATELATTTAPAAPVDPKAN